MTKSSGPQLRQLLLEHREAVRLWEELSQQCAGIAMEDRATMLGSYQAVVQVNDECQRLYLLLVGPDAAGTVMEARKYARYLPPHKLMIGAKGEELPR